MPYPVPVNESQRLTALQECCILDTPPDEGFDQITSIAAEIARVPIALLSLVDASRQWFMSRVGLEAQETPRDLAFCAHAILQSEPLVVPDTALDPRFADNPLVTGPPHIRFYAGFPLELSTGERLGTLCVIDQDTRTLDAREKRLLTALARQASASLELRRACYLLEDANAQRDRLIENLRATHARLEEASRAKSDFLANMSHEIRTPMTAILGFVDLVTDTSLSESERRDHAATIHRNARHLLQIINDILDLSKIEAGKMTIERIDVSPRAIIEDVEQLMRPRATDAGLSLSVSYETAIPRVMQTDPVRLRQILTNLVTNAVKFTERGGVTISVGVDRGPDVMALRFTVEDTGIGIAPDQLDRLFLPFEQADASTTRAFGGTGLGLRISRQLAELLGGTLTACSEPGRGSRFTVSIDLPDGVDLDGGNRTANGEAPARTSTDDHAAAQHAPSDLTGVRILIVDDGQDNQRLLQFHLRRAGSEPVIVEDGIAAVAEVEHAASAGAPYDLIIMDMQMPRMDGYEATRTLRGLGYRTPIIALTAHAMVGDRRKCLEAGCDEYASKPIDPGGLIERCRGVVGRG